MATHYIHFCAGINENTAAQFRELFLKSIAQGASKIVVLLNSDGGSNHSAFGIYSLIRSSPVPVEMYGFGNIESMAVILFLAADVRYCVRHVRFTVHAMHWNFAASTVDAARLAEIAALLTNDRERYSEIFNERTKGAKQPVDVNQHLLSSHLLFDFDAAASAGITTTRATDIRFEAGAAHWWVNP